MTSREDRTRALLEAAARDRQVDTRQLWDRLEPELAARDRRPRSRPWLAVAAAAAVTVGVVGASVWASGWGDPSSPVPAASSAGIVATSPTPAPTTSAPSAPPTATTSPTTDAPSARPIEPTAQPPALSTASLLTAADYTAAGWVADEVQPTKGWGQSTISACQYELPPAASQPGFPEPFRADGYPAAPGLGMAAYQYTFEFGSAATADRVLQTVLTWPEGCGKRIGDAVTSSAPEIHGRSDGREGYWYTMSFKQPDGIQRTELVLVARAADRISLIVLHERGGAQAIDGVDASTLINLQLERLG